MGIEFGKKFRELRKSKGLTQKVLAGKLGLSHVTVVGWEKGEHYPSSVHFPILENMLGIKMSELVGLDSLPSGDDDRDPFPPNPPIETIAGVIPLENVPVRMLPVVGMAAAAHYDPSFGQLCDLFQGAEDKIPCVIPGCEDCFALRICGDSMAPKLLDGDVVAVSDHLPRTGQTCIVMHRTDGILCKRWYWRNGVIRLESINPDGKNYEWTKEEFARDNPFTWRFRVEGIVWRKEY